MPFEIDNVSVELGGRTVLRNISFRVVAGERVVLLGVNGCGKTTLLRLLDGLMPATAGRIRYAGAPLDTAALDDPVFRRTFRSQVGLLFQNVDAMLFNPSVADEIAFGPRQLGLPDTDRRVTRWAETFGVSALLERPPFELSGGEKKRVALAALFAVGPKVLLLDEATANLDPAWSGRVVDFLDGAGGITTIAATHNLSVADELGSRAILLAAERSGVLFDGPIGELLADDQLLVASGLAHRHAHRHGPAEHAHFHVHDPD